MAKEQCEDKPKTLGELNGGWVRVFKVYMPLNTTLQVGILTMVIWLALAWVDQGTRLTRVEGLTCDPVEKRRIVKAIATLEARMNITEKGG